MFCKMCGAQNEDGAVFCASCGKKLETVSETNTIKESASNKVYNQDALNASNYSTPSYGSNSNANYGAYNYGANNNANNYNSSNYGSNDYGQVLNGSSNYNAYGQSPNIGKGYYSYEYTPISMWGYFGYSLLFVIPVIGFVLKIVFAITAKNVNLKNLAIAYLIIEIIGIVILIISATSGVNLLSDILRQFN